MNVRRTLPTRQRSLIGAWCFVDHYGPDDIASTGGMNVAPHPHVGLQTVSWLFQGEIEHRDSAGNHAMVLPGEVNLMTAGRGISHSEVSTDQVTVLHGVQLWVALPEAARNVEPKFAHYAPEPIVGERYEVRVFLGSLLGESSPVQTFTPLLGAELVLHPGARLTVDVDGSFEHGVLLDSGSISVGSPSFDTFTVDKDELAYVPSGSETLTLSAPEGARLVLLGGAAVR
jgi:redox-sensitive bicupin YhaK (pirin superfamily)